MYSSSSSEAIKEAIPELLRRAAEFGLDRTAFPVGQGPQFDDFYNQLPASLINTFEMPFRKLPTVREMPSPPKSDAFYPNLKTKTIRLDLGSGNGFRVVLDSLLKTGDDFQYLGGPVVFVTPEPLHPAIENACCKTRHFSCSKSLYHLHNVLVDEQTVNRDLKGVFVSSFNFLTHVPHSVQASIFAKNGLHLYPCHALLYPAGYSAPDFHDPLKSLVKYGGKVYSEYTVVGHEKMASVTVMPVGFYAIAFVQHRYLSLIGKYTEDVAISPLYEPFRPTTVRPLPVVPPISKHWKLKYDGTLTTWVLDNSFSSGDGSLYRFPAFEGVHGTVGRYDITTDSDLVPCVFATETLSAGRGQVHYFIGFKTFRGVSVKLPMYQQKHLFTSVLDGVQGVNFLWPPIFPSASAANAAMDSTSDGIIDVSDITHYAYKPVQTVDLRYADAAPVSRAIALKTGNKVVVHPPLGVNESGPMVYEFSLTFIDDVIHIKYQRERPDKLQMNSTSRIDAAVEMAKMHPNVIASLLSL